MVTALRCANEADLSAAVATAKGPLFPKIGRPNGTEDPGSIFYCGQGVIEHADRDQIVLVHAGTSFASLNRELAIHGHTLPFIEATERGHRAKADSDTVGQVAAIGIPHPGESHVGSFRDWVLGMTVVLADGQIVECGSRAVKSVAGYDLHKLFLGARHTLGIITRLTLRTYPLPKVENLKFEWTRGKGMGEASNLAVQRTLKADFASAIEAAGASLVLADHGTSTLWRYADREIRRFPSDWVMQPYSPEPPEAPNEASCKYMARIKAQLDPANKLSPGGFGFF